MNNKMAIVLLVVVFVALALMSTADSVIESAAGVLSTYSEEEIERYQETVEEGEKNIMNCVLIIVCLVVGFALGRVGNNVCDGLLVLGSRPGDHQMQLSLPDEALPRCRFIKLKVVNDDN